MAAQTKMMVEVVETKPSGLTKLRFECGCVVWMRPTREGRRVETCREQGTHDLSRWGTYAAAVAIAFPRAS